jgi:uncharacterized membrane protein
MRWLAGLLVPVYPFAIWWALGHWSPRSVALLALALLAVIALCVATVVSDWRPLLLAVPVVMSAFLALVFGRSLASVPLVERFARTHHTPEEMTELASYCRHVTRVWCAFLVANAAVCLALALFAPLQAWAFYTGLVSYLLMGALFAGEWLVRQGRVRAARARVAARAGAGA